MENLIDYTLQQILRLAISDAFQYATGACIIVGLFGIVYKLMKNK